MKHHPDHPCGALPISQWHLTVWYCTTHDAFFASTGGHTETKDGGLLTTSKYSTVEFGPFDTPTDVQHWVQTQLPSVRKLKQADK